MPAVDVCGMLAQEKQPGGTDCDSLIDTSCLEFGKVESDEIAVGGNKIKRKVPWCLGGGVREWPFMYAIEENIG